MSNFFIKRYAAATDWAGNYSPECFQIETYHPHLNGRFSASPEFATRAEAEKYLDRLKVAAIRAEQIMSGKVNTITDGGQ